MSARAPGGGWLGSVRRWWRERGAPAVELTDAQWRQALARLPVLHDYYADAELARLRALAGEFLASKRILGAGGLELSFDMALHVAVQACLPVLNLGLRWYRGWVTVLVYPGEFLARHEYVDEAGVVHHLERPLTGEAWDGGPVLVAWEQAAGALSDDDWGSVVIHECAHKLDGLNGAVNGMPPLHREMDRPRWTRVLAAAYADFTARAARGEPLFVDEYAAEDPAEFFAVLSEAFFGVPEELQAVYPEVYREFRDFYRQDLAQRVSELAAGGRPCQ